MSMGCVCCASIVFYHMSLQLFCQTYRIPLLYCVSNLNHLIKHTHMHIQTHTHIYTVSMETGSRAFYDWLFAQDNQKWSRQPRKDGR